MWPANWQAHGLPHRQSAHHRSRLRGSGVGCEDDVEVRRTPLTPVGNSRAGGSDSQDAPAYLASYSSIVADALSDEPSREVAERVLDQIMINWRGLLQRFGRVVWLTAVLMAVFFLLGSGNVSEVGLAGVKVSKAGLTVVSKVIPPVVAILFGELWLLGRYADLLTAVHNRLMTIVARKELPPPVIDVVEPFGMSYSGMAGPLLGESVPGYSRANKWLLWSTAGNFIVMFLGPVAFLIYAYVALFAHDGFADPLVWIGITVVGVNLARVVALWNIL